MNKSLEIAKQVIDLQRFDQTSFEARYGGLYEHSKWVATRAWTLICNQPSITVETLSLEMKTIVDKASSQQKLALLRAHPELAGKAATEGTLTVESTDEQASARLDLCSQEEFKRFHQLNALYNEKFDFPFILAVRNKTRADVLDAFEERINNSVTEEFDTALEQVHQIALLRMHALHSE